MGLSESLQQAKQEWQRIVGAEGVLEAKVANARYGQCTTPCQRVIPLALKVSQRDQVIDIVKVANKYKIPIYPISTGNNWGYGSSLPAKDNCVVVDLSAMKKILSFDEELGIVTLEPGVTQGQLAEYLEKNDLPFLVPVTGSGPTCSLLGNALERGYGITPHADHFAAVTSIEAVLAEGTVYRSALDEWSGTEVSRSFKWGLGPYLDGIFTQSNLGVVTSMSIALARRPANVQGFFFSVTDEHKLEDVVRAIRTALQRTQGVTGSINLMNSRRVMAMMMPYPHELVVPDRIIPHEQVAELASKFRVTAWTGAGALYGEKAVVNAAKGVIKGLLRGHVSRLNFVNSSSLSGLENLLSRLRISSNNRLLAVVKKLGQTMSIMEGRPSEVALPLAYWKSGIPAVGKDKNPARDGCGLIWYAPLVPMKPPLVREYVDLVDAVCADHGIEPLVTLTTLSERCFDSTVPILYDLASEAEAKRAEACYLALFEEGKKRGFLPYRLGVNSMHLINDEASIFWTVQRKISASLDPNQIISPGRYDRGAKPKS